MKAGVSDVLWPGIVKVGYTPQIAEDGVTFTPQALLQRGVVEESTSVAASVSLHERQCYTGQLPCFHLG